VKNSHFRDPHTRAVRRRGVSGGRSLWLVTEELPHYYVGAPISPHWCSQQCHTDGGTDQKAELAAGPGERRGGAPHSRLPSAMALDPRSIELSLTPSVDGPIVLGMVQKSYVVDGHVAETGRSFLLLPNMPADHGLAHARSTRMPAGVGDACWNRGSDSQTTRIDFTARTRTSSETR